MILKWILCILTLSFASQPCWASNALRGKLFSSEIAKSKAEAVVVRKRVVNSTSPIISYEDVARIVPTNIDPNADSSQVTNQILQRSATAIFNAPIIQNSFLMKTAKKVENTTKMDVAIKNDDKNAPASQKEVEHKFNFDVQAFKGEAKITYTGLIDSRVEYQALNDTLSVSIEEQLSENSRLALSHLKDRDQSRQLLQYEVRW